MKMAWIVRRIGLLIVAALVLSTVSLGSTEALAQSRSLTDGPPVRRQLLHRSSKLELAPGIAAMFGNGFQTPLYLNLGVRYHLSNSVSLGVDLNGSPIAVDRRVVRELDDIDPQAAAGLEVANTPFLGSFQVSYAPIVGKINFFGNKIAYIDVHLFGGVGGALQTSDVDALSGFSFGGVIGVGARLFFDDGIAINLRFSDYLYSNAEAAQDGRVLEERFRQHYVVGLSVGFFLPRATYVSR